MCYSSLLSCVQHWENREWRDGMKNMTTAVVAVEWGLGLGNVGWEMWVGKMWIGNLRWEERKGNKKKHCSGVGDIKAGTK